MGNSHMHHKIEVLHHVLYDDNMVYEPETLSRVVSPLQNLIINLWQLVCEPRAHSAQKKGRSGLIFKPSISISISTSTLISASVSKSVSVYIYICISVSVPISICVHIFLYTCRTIHLPINLSIYTSLCKYMNVHNYIIHLCI